MAAGSPGRRVAEVAEVAGSPGRRDFMSRQRVLRPGRTVIEGHAWSGWAPVTAVEVGVDGGSWVPAQLEPAPDR